MKALGSRVVAVIAASMGLNARQVRRADGLVADLGMESLDLVELVMALEREFSITIDDMVAEGLDTVDDAIGYVEELVLRKARRAA